MADAEVRKKELSIKLIELVNIIAPSIARTRVFDMLSLYGIVNSST